MPWTRALVVLLLLPCFAFGGDPVPGPAAAFAKGNTAFTCDLYAKLRLEKGNLFFSPYSISTCLAMTREGARGETAAQMDRVLHFPEEGLGEGFRAIAKALAPAAVPEGSGRERRTVPAYELTTANRLWGQAGFAFEPPFVQQLADVYGAPMEQIDFQEAAKARARINGWVEEQTRDKIQDLLPAGTPTPDTRLVLVNAVYFKSAWQHPFSERATKDRPFTRLDGSTVDAPMLAKTHGYGYARSDDVQILDLPYRGGDLSMVVLLPRAKDGLPGLEAALTRDRLAAWLSGVEGARVSVVLPKFSFTKGFDLTSVLPDMGMADAFSPTQADFTGMTVEKPLYIGLVVHKGFVAVDEKGTEAAAATAVAMRLGGAPHHDQPVEFKADHPFLFLIRHRPTGCILFVGRVLDPTA